MTLLKFLGFTMLITLVFMPLINLVLILYKEDVSDMRKNIGACFLSAALFALNMTMGLQIKRFIIQAFVSYFIVLWMMKYNVLKSIYVLATMYAITAVVESVIIYFCSTTVLGFSNIMEIDAFYALMVALQAAVLWLVYILSERSIRQFHRRRALKQKTIK